MKRLGFAKIGWLSAAVLPLLGGCAVATDLVNPDLLTGLGVDVDTVISPQGRLIVTFNNTTNFPAEMFVSVSTNSTDPSASFSTDSVPVAAGEARSLAYSCPIAVIAPGDVIDQNFGATGTVAVIGAGDAVVEIGQDSAALVSGRDYSCGAVIEIRLVQVATGDEGNIITRVEVIPGR
ncbi:MAG: hypothetical protein ACKVS9_18870 [Phycisphaerae bacterium]